MTALKDNWTVASESADILGDFVVEARALLDQAESTFLALETELTQEGIASAFRCFHTIKGVSGFLELTVVIALAHRVESLLARVRDGASPPLGFVDLVLGAVDRMRACIAFVHSPEGTPPDVSEFLAKLDQVEGKPVDPVATPVVSAPAVTAPVVSAPVAPVVAPVVTAITEAPPAPVKVAPRAATAQSDDATVRVDLGKMDHILDLVGELAIAQAQVVAHPDLPKLQTSSLVRALAQVSRVARDLQRASLAMRMVPIKGTFDRIARIARDTARNLDKPIKFTTEGSQTEIDRTMAEAIYEPLVHMVRNAIDHGLETREQRVATDKHEVGHIELRAFHEGSHVIIELVDDGRGLDRTKILARARQRGLVTEDAQPTNAEIDQMIFLPGFSTAEKVTSVSGRGVGMDVVKTNIERVCGRVDILSEPGRGSTFRVQLPLTLAIVDGLLFSLGDQRFIVPAIFVRDVFRPTADQISTVQGRGELVTVRGRSYVIRRLARELGGGDPALPPTQGVLIMVDHADQPVCLLVDSLIGKQEVVVKGLGPMFADVHGLTGGAILGDGRIALILDIPTLLARKARSAA